MCGGGRYTYIRGRCYRSESFLSMPPFINNDSFLCLEVKNVSDHAIMAKKHICNYLINKANIKLSYISENIIIIIGKLINRPLCLVCGVQLACIV